MKVGRRNRSSVSRVTNIPPTCRSFLMMLEWQHISKSATVAVPFQCCKCCKPVCQARIGRAHLTAAYCGKYVGCRRYNSYKPQKVRSWSWNIDFPKGYHLKPTLQSLWNVGIAMVQREQCQSAVLVADETSSVPVEVQWRAHGAQEWPRNNFLVSHLQRPNGVRHVLIFLDRVVSFTDPGYIWSWK